MTHHKFSACRTPTGLEDVSKYPELFAELLARGWSETDIQKLAGLNLIRVFKAVEQVNYSLSKEKRELSLPTFHSMKKSGRVPKVKKSELREEKERTGEKRPEKTHRERERRERRGALVSVAK